MVPKKNQSDIKVITLDIGDSFAKIGLFGRDLHGIKLLDAQNNPILDEGLLIDSEKQGTAEVSFAVTDLIKTANKPVVLASTTRFPKMRVLLVGLSNLHIEKALKFCQQVNLEAAAVLTRDKLVWADQAESAGKPESFDLVMLVGGFERKKESHLKELIEMLLGILEGCPNHLPIFFLGCEEILEKVQYLFEGKRQVYLIPELWPEKKDQNFLPLYIHLQDVIVKKSLSDPFLSRFIEANDCELESGTSAILASLSHLTEKWQKDVLLIDIGSRKTVVCWSKYNDGFLIPVLSDKQEERIIFQADGDSGSEESQFGLRLFDFGLGGDDIEKILEILDLRGASFRWPEDSGITLEDRIFNHSMLHSGVVPDQTDHIWLEALLLTFLENIWQSIPPDLNPAHIVFSGSFFSSGLRIEHFIDNVLIPSEMPFSAGVWINKGPNLSLYGLLMKLDEHMNNVGVDQMVQKVGEYVNILGRGDRKNIKATLTLDTRKDAVDEYTLLVDSVQKIKFEAQNRAIVKINPTKNCHVVGYKKGEEVIVRTEPGLAGLIVDGRVNR